MDIMEVFEKIRQSPGIYIDGDMSLKRVRSFMVGYEAGAASTPRELTDQAKFEHFNGWVASRLGYSSSTGWCNMILERAGSDEKAYNMFFELLDEFRRRRGASSNDRTAT
jgi:hypothetical protein